LATLLALLVAVPYAAIHWQRRTPPARQVPASFQLDLGDQVAVDAQLLGYRQVEQMALTVDQPQALAVGPRDQLYVAGDRQVCVYAAVGDRPRVIPLPAAPFCLAVGGPQHAAPGQVYVGTAAGVAVLDASRQPVATWDLPAEGSRLTSVALAEQDVFLADAGTRVVWRYSTAGEPRGELGRADPERGVAGFIVPSPCFDIAIGAPDLIHIVNPGLLQVATFNFNGDLGATWGRASSSIEGFFGCCNPAHIAILSDGSVVTSEKGIPRIKTYDPSGNLLAVVAGPEELGVPAAAIGDPRRLPGETASDIAVDSQDRVLVLDARNRLLRIFQENEDR
jgi:hypothetical protein